MNGNSANRMRGQNQPQAPTGSGSSKPATSAHRVPSSKPAKAPTGLRHDLGQLTACQQATIGVKSQTPTKTGRF